jgi:hypothetical protein
MPIPPLSLRGGPSPAGLAYRANGRLREVVAAGAHRP